MTNHPKTSPNINKLTLKFIHCNKTGHTKNLCFEIVGYPDQWDHNRDQQKNDSEKASALVATTDYDGKFLNTSTLVINSAWIIDYGVTNHMTFDSRQVSPLRPFSQKIVSTANGNTTLVIGE